VTGGTEQLGGDSMSKGIVARASTDIKSPIDKVWEALANPATIKQYFFGTVSPPMAGRIIAIPQVGGLHHRYERIAA
jgi:uncharacterized protein YndB with AHSA1/START domain